MYINKSIKKYLDDLGAKIPAPGGGCAAALSSAMAASLVVMVCQFTLGKNAYQKQEKAIRAIFTRSMQIRKRLSELVDEDVEAYGSRDWKRAILVPAEVCFLSHELMALAQEVLARGNKRLSTDAGLAVLLAASGFLGGLSYVEINIRALKEKTKTDQKLLKKLKIYRKSVLSIRKKVEGTFGHSFGW